MITEKLMMPYVIASQHPIVNLAMGFIMLYTTIFHSEDADFQKDKIKVLENDYLSRAIPFAYNLQMSAHLSAFVLHVIIARLNLSENVNNYNKYVFITKYLMIVKVLSVFFSITYAQVILVRIEAMQKTNKETIMI